MHQTRSRALPEKHLSPSEERARLYALKGYLRGRDGQFDRAEEQFVRAVTLDPKLDLTSIPNFWTLPRGAHNAAVAALESLERYRDAARLAATIDRHFRPRLVEPRPLVRRPS